MSSKRMYKTIIIGCGAIAGGYDEKRSSSEVFSHAGAYRADGRFEVVACVEPDEEKRFDFMARWAVAEGYPDLPSLLKAGVEFELASLCVPTSLHAELLEQLLKTSCRLVFCEKPVTADIADARRLVAAFEHAGKGLAVNYSRRWDPAMITLAAEIADGVWGALQSATGWYGKGILNNGSHLIDLLHFLIGQLKAHSAFCPRHDLSATDPTPNAILFTEGDAPIHLIGTDSRLFQLFELALVFEKGTVGIEDNGFIMRPRTTQPHPRFDGYTSLTRGDWQDTGLGRALPEALANIYDWLENGTPLRSTGKNALAAQVISAELTRMCRA
jgi:predicted dehydrogenase